MTLPGTSKSESAAATWYDCADLQRQLQRLSAFVTVVVLERLDRLPFTLHRGNQSAQFMPEDSKHLQIKEVTKLDPDLV